MPGIYGRISNLVSLETCLNSKLYESKMAGKSPPKKTANIHRMGDCAGLITGC